MWKSQLSLEGLNNMNADTIVSHLGIEFSDFGADFLEAKMPVDSRTVQPFRILHGGASVVLAETLGSIAAQLCLDPLGGQGAVGLEVNANHLRKARSGYVYGRCEAIKIGRTVHVWEIKIRDEAGKMICISRLTMSIIDMK